MLTRSIMTWKMRLGTTHIEFGWAILNLYSSYILCLNQKLVPVSIQTLLGVGLIPVAKSGCIRARTNHL